MAHRVPRQAGLTVTVADVHAALAGARQQADLVTHGNTPLGLVEDIAPCGEHVDMQQDDDG